MLAVFFKTGFKLNILFNSGKIDTVKMLNCSIHKYAISLKLFSSPFISFKEFKKFLKVLMHFFSVGYFVLFLSKCLFYSMLYFNLI